TVGHVGGVPLPAQAHLDHGHVDGDVGEPPVGGGGEDLEEAGPVVEERLQGGDAGHYLGQGAVGDGLVVPGQALVHPFQVRAGVRAHGQALGAYQGAQHAGGGGLAVGAGEVHDRVLALGFGHHVHELAHAVEGGGVHPPGGDGLQVHVRIEVRERVGQVPVHQRASRGATRARTSCVPAAAAMAR